MSLENKKGKYDYLKKYIGNVGKYPENQFFQINHEEIIEAEQRLGTKFPESLKEFWLEVGCGFLRRSIHGDETDTNRICSPDQIADIMLLKEESGLIIGEAIDLLREGDIVFFEVGDSEDFLVMRPQSKHPNGIYYLGIDKLAEKNFEDFIWRLYHEHPIFYYKN